MRYTVIGLVDNTTVPRQLTVAAVIEGEHWAVDQDDGDESAQRWAGSYDAEDPLHAEALAHADLIDEDDQLEVER